MEMGISVSEAHFKSSKSSIGFFLDLEVSILSKYLNSNSLQTFKDQSSVAMIAAQMQPCLKMIFD
jgi:hypothetical protein